MAGSSPSRSEPDLDAIGKHCHWSHCRQLDFLPLQCPSCKYYFCSPHQSEDAHQCSRAGRAAKQMEEERNRAASKVKSIPVRKVTCSLSSCRKVVDASQTARCRACRREYCLQHRMEDSHHCAPNVRTEQPHRQKGATKVKAGSTIQAKLSSFLSQFKKYSTHKPHDPATDTVQFSTPHQRAPPHQIRLTIETEWVNEKGTRTAVTKLYQPDHSVGRVLDDCCKDLKVQNSNATTRDETQRLKFYHIRTGTFLSFQAKIGAVCKSGDKLSLYRGIVPT